MSIVIFPGNKTNIKQFQVISLKVCINKEQNVRSFKVISVITFYFQFFLTSELHHKPFTKRLFRQEFLGVVVERKTQGSK